MATISEFEQCVRAEPRVMPVLDLNSVALVRPLADLLRDYGIGIAEVTLRSAAALDCIATMRQYAPELYVGAGTVRNVSEHDQAVAAGAMFTVSPGLSAELVLAAQRARLPHVPGVATATEVMSARNLGLNFLKFFPAGAAGGIAMLKSWGGPFSDVVFCPTGGIDAQNYRDYLALPNVACVGASSFFPSAAMVAGEWGTVRQRLNALRAN